MQLNEERNQFENISILCLFVCWFLIQFGALAFYSIDYDHTFAPGTQTTATAQFPLRMSKMCFCYVLNATIEELVRKYQHANDNCSAFFITCRVRVCSWCLCMSNSYKFALLWLLESRVCISIGWMFLLWCYVLGFHVFFSSSICLPFAF